eukprot:11476162-Prorocentrum_lima.AAC.1
MEDARVYREWRQTRRFAFCGRRKRTQAQLASMMEPKHEHAFKRPRVIPPRQNIAHQSLRDADTEATT